MTWLMGILGLLLGAATGYIFGWLTGVDVSSRTVLSIVCEKCAAEFERIYNEIGK